jgi:hypothetical protein
MSFPLQTAQCRLRRVERVTGRIDVLDHPGTILRTVARPELVTMEAVDRDEEESTIHGEHPVITIALRIRKYFRHYSYRFAQMFFRVPSY